MSRSKSNLADPVQPAVPGDLAYIVDLQKKYSYEVGFISRMALAKKIELSRIWLARENGQPAGYLHHGSLARPEARIFQAAIQYDAQRRHLGAALVERFERRAADHGVIGLSLRCLDDLDANQFWDQMGYTRFGIEPGAKGRLNIWIKKISGTSGRGRGARKETILASPHPSPLAPLPLPLTPSPSPAGCIPVRAAASGRPTPGAAGDCAGNFAATACRR